jgi:3-deoxy-D-arabino-heptulosonate 7-phosphate (DAHP) synthase class II
MLLVPPIVFTGLFVGFKVEFLEGVPNPLGVKMKASLESLLIILH